MDEVIVTVNVVHHFDAAHKLRNYNGQCANLHGHRWTVKLSITGRVNPKTGMLCDFKKVKEIIDGFDHADLNKKVVQPTAENLAVVIGRRIQEELNEMDNKATLAKLELFETPETSVEVKWTNC